MRGKAQARDSWTGHDVQTQLCPGWGRVPRLGGQWLPPDPRSGTLSLDPVSSSSPPPAGVLHCGRRGFDFIYISSQNSKSKIYPESPCHAAP